MIITMLICLVLGFAMGFIVGNHVGAMGAYKKIKSFNLSIFGKNK